MAAVKISSARRQAAQKFRAPQQCSFLNINRDAGPYGVRLSGCAGIRETADMDATVPLHDNRPARLRAVRGSGSGDGGTSDSMRNLFVPWLESDKGNPKTVGFWRRFCILLPPRAKGCRAGARNIPAGGKHAGRGCSPQSENRKRAVGDAGPYGVRDRRHDEIRVGGVCPLGAFKRGTRERVAFSGRL